MNLQEYCNSISEEELFRLAINACEAALPVWIEYSQNNELTYRDTVVGLGHRVDANLLQNSINFCKGEILTSDGLAKLLYEFLDPIVSIKDFDWDLPMPAESIFFSVYNLLKGIENRFDHHGDSYHYMSIYQAADALDGSGLMSIEEFSAIYLSAINEND